MRYFTVLLLCIIGGAVAFSGTALDDYVNFDDGAFSYSLLNTTTGSTNTIYTILLTSQKWQTPEFSSRHVWQHLMGICVPNRVITSHGFLFIDGGSDSSVRPSLDFITPICELGAITASVRQVPSQPITFPGTGPLLEDEIIAHTFRAFLNGTGENPSQLLLFPMTKAAKRSLDVVQDFVLNQIPGRSFNIPTFTVAGASKRGWTTWLLAAVDERVTSCVPIVLAVLNMQTNVPDSWRSFGEWGYALLDYTNERVFDFIGSPMFDLLTSHVDPISYNDRYERVNKLVLDASMDQFFLLDSPKYFYAQLKGPKRLVVLPNADHSFTIPTSINTALQIIASFFAAVATGTPLPELSWSLRYSNSSSVIPNVVVSTPNANQLVSIAKYTITTTRPGIRDFRFLRCRDTNNPACFNYIVNGVQWTPVPLTPSSVNGNTATFEGNLTDLVIASNISDQRWTGLIVQATFRITLPNGLALPLILTSEANIFPDFYPFPPYHFNYEAIGYCKLALDEKKTSSWTSGSVSYSLWTVSLSVSDDLYSAKVEVDGPIVNLYGLDSVSNNVYSIPSYYYINGKIPAGSSVTFGYTIASASKASVKFVNNACYPSYSSQCSVSVTPSVTGQWTVGNTHYESVSLTITNTGTGIAPNTDITFHWAEGTYFSQVWNLQRKEGVSNTYTCSLYNLPAGQSSYSCGYIVAYTTETATVESTRTYCL